MIDLIGLAEWDGPVVSVHTGAAGENEFFDAVSASGFEQDSRPPYVHVLIEKRLFD